MLEMPETTGKMGLAAWDQPLDIYNYQQFANNWNIVDFHDHTPGRGVQIPYGGIAPGAVSKANLAFDVPIAQRNATLIPTSQSITSVSYGTLATPDQVTGVVLPTKGLIAVWYHATWQSSGSALGRAAIFLNAIQLKNAANPIAVQETQNTGTANNDVLFTTGSGLLTGTITAYPGDVTTGMSLGTNVAWTGPTYIWAAAGTYTVSIQFKSASGSVTVANRMMWVEALTFI